MVRNFFGGGRAVEEMVGELTLKVDKQSAQLITAGEAISGLESVVATMRSYNEAMEARLQTEFAKGFDRAVATITAELAKVKTGAPAKEVVKAIGDKGKEERRTRNLNTVVSNLNGATAKYLVNDLPLARQVGTYKSPTLTPQGEKMYEAISQFIVDLAKVTGVKKETYTNGGKYAIFFRQFGIKRYKRAPVRKQNGTNIETLLGTIIVNGHVKQYVNYLIQILDNERKAQQ